MAQNDKRRDSRTQDETDVHSIGNRQQTTQTGAQNAGGENIDQEEDQYTEDLRQSGRRSSRKDNEGSSR